MPPEHTVWQIGTVYGLRTRHGPGTAVRHGRRRARCTASTHRIGHTSLAVSYKAGHWPTKQRDRRLYWQNEPNGHRLETWQNEPNGQRPETWQNEPNGQRPETWQNEPNGRRPETWQNEPNGRRPETWQNEPNGQRPETWQNEPTGSGRRPGRTNPTGSGRRLGRTNPKAIALVSWQNEANGRAGVWQN